MQPNPALQRVCLVTYQLSVMMTICESLQVHKYQKHHIQRLDDALSLIVQEYYKSVLLKHLFCLFLGLQAAQAEALPQSDLCKWF